MHPSIPHVLHLQAVDPLDPWLQQLVQDKYFSAAVEAGQLHAAAAAATKVIRVRMLNYCLLLSEDMNG